VLIQDLTPVEALDGYPLAATCFQPGERPVGSVAILSATGVRRRYYAPFAAFLAERGLRVLTFDYRGIGDSRPPSLRGFGARMHDWAALDAAGALRYLREAQGEVATLVVGHSFGGQALGLLPQPLGVGAALLVAAQSGYWGHWRGWPRLGMAALWHAVVPLLCRVLGYFPARRLGLGEDLPSGVARQWASWGRRPGYVFEAEGGRWQAGYRQVTLPIRAYSFSDDGFAPRPAVEALLAGFENAGVEHRHLAPAALGLPGVGHWGFFREPSRQALWREARDWLRLQAGG
jgi:predicted alpha/beta hydrolase